LIPALAVCLSLSDLQTQSPAQAGLFLRAILISGDVGIQQARTSFGQFHRFEQTRRETESLAHETDDTQATFAGNSTRLDIHQQN
jgi:hypothetical protein